MDKTINVAVRTPKPFRMHVFDQSFYQNAKTYHKDIISQCLRKHGNWETLETELVLDWMSGSGGLFVDVGCHIGYYTLMMANHGHSVVAFEANPAYLKLLDKSLQTKEPLRSLVTIHNQRMGEEKGCRLSDFIAPNQRIRLLKVDIEGGEPAVLRGAKDILHLVDAAVIEISPCFHARTPLKEYIDLTLTMRDQGFRVFDIGLSNPRRLQKVTGTAARVLRDRPELTHMDASALRAYLNKLRQTNFFFVTKK